MNASTTSAKTQKNARVRTPLLIDASQVVQCAGAPDGE
jgi:hypothetical protein